MQEIALNYLQAGLCVLPADRKRKFPTVGKWTPFKTRLPSDIEIGAWFSNTQSALCIVCGVVSDNLEMIDFDNGGELFDAWAAKIPQKLLNRLVIESTQSGGRHVAYRCESEISGNLKLAQRSIDDGVITLIETRGQGGLFLCAPTDGYELLQGELTDLPVLTTTERELLLQAAADLDEIVDSQPDNSNKCPWSSESLPGTTLPGDYSNDPNMPGGDFNIRGDIRPILEKHGWSYTGKSKDDELWRRTGKDDGTHSASFNGECFFVYSTNAYPFEAFKGHSKFKVYTLLEHGGDFSASTRDLSAQGYGDSGSQDTDVDISAIVGMSVEKYRCSTHDSHGGDSEDDQADSVPVILRLEDLIDNFTGLNPPVIHGLLREGETMNIIASPKMGKSWFVSRLSISIASGLDWFGLAVEQGRVLHIDNELHSNTLAYRYKVLSEAMDLPLHLFIKNIDMVSLRGQLRDLYSMDKVFCDIESGRYKLVIIDAFYRMLPKETDENANGAIAYLYNYIDRYAGQLQCAFALIHHASKGNQSGKAVTDVGAGAGSQSRAADTHMILRPHEEEGITVLESAVRSWPPMEPLALSWDWPLFTPTNEVDTSALLGVSKPKAKARDIPLEDFVEQCVAVNDPCSKRSVRHEAGQAFSLSERQANEKLDLAIERDLVSRIRTGSYMWYVMNRPGVSGDKGLWTAALLAHDPEANAQEIADTVGTTRQYVNKIRRSMFGNCLETDGN